MPVFPITCDSATDWFLDGCRRGEFLLLRRGATGEWFEPNTDRERFDDLSPARSTGMGTVVSWSSSPAVNADGETPQPLFGVVELDEGPWWWGELSDPNKKGDPCGQRVKVAFEPSGPDPEHAILPVFVLVETEQSEEIGQ